MQKAVSINSFADDSGEGSPLASSLGSERYCDDYPGKSFADHRLAPSSLPKRVKVGEVVDMVGCLPLSMFWFFLLMLIQCAFAFAQTILAFLAPRVAVVWDLTPVQTGLLPVAMFSGFFFGAQGMGFFADRYGRRPALIVALLQMFIFCLGSSFANSPVFFCTSWFLIGFGMGGIAVPYHLAAEFVPSKCRAELLVFMDLLWGPGSALAAAIGWIVLRPGSRFYSLSFVGSRAWSWYMGFSSLVLLFALVLACCLPESIRFQVLHGRIREAYGAVRRMRECSDRCGGSFQENPCCSAVKCRPPGGEVLPLEFEFEISQCRKDKTKTKLDRRLQKRRCCCSCCSCEATELCHAKVLYPLVVGCVMWCLGNSVYYGIMMQVPQILATKYIYLGGIISALAEVPAQLLPILVTSIVGPRLASVGFFALSAACSFVMLLPLSDEIMLVVACVLRGCSAAALAVGIAVCAQSLPTSVRALGMGFISASGKIGAIVTPFLCQAFPGKHHHGVKIILGAASVLTVFVALLHPGGGMAEVASEQRLSCSLASAPCCFKKKLNKDEDKKKKSEEEDGWDRKPRVVSTTAGTHSFGSFFFLKAERESEEYGRDTSDDDDGDCRTYQDGGSRI